MTAHELLTSLEGRGVKVELDLEQTGLLVTATRGKLTESERQQIREAKPALVSLLRTEQVLASYRPERPALAEGQPGDARLVRVAVVTVEGLPPVVMSPEEAEEFDRVRQAIASHNEAVRAADEKAAKRAGRQT
jgi:hypothetical protein